MLLHPASCGKSPTLTMREWQAFFRPVAKKSRPAAVRPARTPSRAFPTVLPYKAFSSSGAFPGSGARDEIVLSKPAAQRLQRFGPECRHREERPPQAHARQPPLGTRDVRAGMVDFADDPGDEEVRHGLQQPRRDMGGLRRGGLHVQDGPHVLSRHKERRAALRVGDVLAGQVYHQIFMEYGRLRLDDPPFGTGLQKRGAERALPGLGRPGKQAFPAFGHDFLRSGLSPSASA